MTVIFSFKSIEIDYDNVYILIGLLKVSMIIMIKNILILLSKIESLDNSIK